MSIMPPTSNRFTEMAPPPDDSMANDGENLHLINLLRVLRAEIQDLQSLMATIRKGQVSMGTYAGLIKMTRNQVNSIVKKLDDPNNPELIRQLQNGWELISACPLVEEPEGTYEAKEQLNYLEMLDGQFSRVVFLIGHHTIPERVNDWLKHSRPGYYLPFNLVFEDELPSADDRQKVLNYLAWAPEVVENGIVDPYQGLIYRYAHSRKERLVSIWTVIGIFMLYTLIVIGSIYLGELLPKESWPLSAANLGLMTIGWLALLAGVVVHIAVGSVKNTKERGGLPPVLAVNDLPLVIDARKGQIIMKLSLALIGLFFLVFVSGINKITVLNTFLLGYSLDSFIELFGTSLEQQSQALAGTIKKQLNIS